jgi:renalase
VTAAVAPTVVVGAGISGLSCAEHLSRLGHPCIVVERARGVGGRCATRRIESQPVDHGVSFFHGTDPELLAALHRLPATRLDGWPHVIDGTGRPCQPTALSAGSWRLAFEEGLNVFPRHLAKTLDVRLEQRVTGLKVASSAFEVAFENGTTLTVTTLVLALAAEQSLSLMTPELMSSPEIRSAHALLSLASSQPCLTVIATYPTSTPRPSWEVSYPETSRVLQMVSHDSSKRPGAPRLTLVLQAHAAWSAQHLEDAHWPEHLLTEAAKLYGPWAGTPADFQSHRWRYARSDNSTEMAGPVLFKLPEGARLGLTGERFSPGAGIEGAWRSGRRLAQRVIQET